MFYTTSIGLCTTWDDRSRLFFIALRPIKEARQSTRNNLIFFCKFSFFLSLFFILFFLYLLYSLFLFSFFFWNFLNDSRYSFVDRLSNIFVKSRNLFYFIFVHVVEYLYIDFALFWSISNLSRFKCIQCFSLYCMYVIFNRVYQSSCAVLCRWGIRGVSSKGDTSRTLHVIFLSFLFFPFCFFFLIFLFPFLELKWHLE